jgi:predicted amidohydrolase YtcJ
MIITNAKVLTMDPAAPRAGAVAIAGGKILAVGSADEIGMLTGAETRVIDAGGRSVLPGFVESHLHLVLGGNELTQLQLGGVLGFDALQAAFVAYAAANPDAPLLMAQGAAYEILGNVAVTRGDLDRIIADRPIAMTSPDHHTVWANTAALQAAGLLHGATMPRGHEVVMAPDGTAAGELREFEAFSPILALGGELHLQLGIATGGEPDPWPDAAQRAIDKDKVAAGLAHCARHGITSMVNMDGNLYTLRLLQEMQAEGRLTARVKVPFHMKPHMELSELERATAMTEAASGDWVFAGFVKMFQDGVVDSRTAYMLQNYPGTEARSEPLFPPERFKDICVEADRRGLQIAVHAIGDGAVQVTIDGYEAAQQRNGRRDSRHRIEHIELIDRVDVPRLGALGITASVQPPHPPGVMDFPLSTMGHVFHRDRWKDAYLWKSLADQGAPLAFASDWPVTDVSVMRGIQAALTRVPFEGCQDERVDLGTVLHAYTAGGAWAAHMDGVTGRLIPGLAADIVVIDGDIEAIPAMKIGATGIALTVSGGRITHQVAGFA